MSIIPDPISEPERRTSDRTARLVATGELVASITHDLRQPLTAIEMNIAAALRLLGRGAEAGTPPPDAARLSEAASALRDALVEQRRMREALQALQDLAAMREPAFRPVDLERCVRDVVRFISSETLARRVLVEVVCSAPVSKVPADETLVRQALLNVLMNAVDATVNSTHPGGPLTVAIRPFGQDAVEVAVTYYGRRLEDANADDWGIALARSVIDTHAAHLVVEGDPEHGVSVVMRWPLRARVDAGVGTAVLSGGSDAGK